MTFDYAIVGAGIAGASLAAVLAPHGRVLLLEAEEAPGYHATGRSAAFWEETYGGPGVQPLTRASHPFLATPPPAFHDRGFLSARGALYLARSGERAQRDAFVAGFAARGVEVQPVGRERLEALVPGLGDQWRYGVLAPGCADIDVAGLHAAYLRAAGRAGAELRTRAPLERAERLGAGWRIHLGGDPVEASLLVNAAGAWADVVATRAGVAPIGIQPRRRTMVQLRATPAVDPALPLILALDDSFYVKPEAGGRLWLTPQDETPVPPGDAAPEEMDVATAIARMEAAFDWRVEAVERRWAGLRSFAPDRLPVIGPDPDEPSFFWFAGQGGFGIQTAPAAAALAAARMTGGAPPPGIDAAAYDPGRLR